MNSLAKAFTVLLPWSLKRLFLQKWYGYEIHKSAKIGLAWVFPHKLIMEAHTRVDHFTVAVNLDRIHMKPNSTIGRGNWITGFSTRSNSLHFRHQTDRRAELLLGESSAITKNHHIDCTNTITIGRYATIAGYDSQLLTHSIDVFEGQQNSEPISIGDYTFIGTNVVILGGSKLPAYSVLGAKSLLNKKYDDEWTLYSGVPAKNTKAIPQTAKYFTRTDGFVI